MTVTESQQACGTSQFAAGDGLRTTTPDVRPPKKMNCPSRVDPEALPKGWNQNPDQLVLETNKQFSNRANLTQHRDHRIPLEQPQEDALDQDGHVHHPPASIDDKKDAPRSLSASASVQDVAPGQPPRSPIKLKALKLFQTLRKFATFIGPGFMVAVAYIDPGKHGPKFFITLFPHC